MFNLDTFLTLADNALKTMTGANHAARPCPGTHLPMPELTAQEQRHAAGLMRVNHVGEVCAQALYSAQALGAHQSHVQGQLRRAAQEETDHLAWTQRRLSELGSRPSLLNPVWYAGAFALGLVAGRAGDSISLGFVSETERQVEQHLESHLDRLPVNDTRSRAIVEQMKVDESSHGQAARAAGGGELPLPVRWAMRAAAKVMTTTAYYI
jgi:3-demethoxyubiquinol 3-hydroxylase